MWRALTEERLRSVADTLLGTERLLMSVSAIEAAAHLGWRVLDVVPGAVMTLDPGLGLGDAGATFTLDQHDRVTGILADVSESTTDAGEASRAFRRDVFAFAAGVLTAAYGRPMTRRPGERPEVWWCRGTLTLKLRIGWLSTDLELVGNEDLARVDDWW
jgi:hypothetical protein